MSNNVLPNSLINLEQPLTYGQLVASPILTEVTNMRGMVPEESQYVSITNTEPIPVSGTFTAEFPELQDVNIVSSVTITVDTGLVQPLTDAELRAAPVVVSATDFDVRNFDFSTDSIDVTGSTVSVDNFPATQTVVATDLDIRDLSFATDSVNVSGSTVSVDNFPASQVVEATDLDIRNLAFATDKVDASGSSVSVTNLVSVQDDYALGEVLPDQTGANNVLTFTFSQPVVSFWVAVIGLTGVVKVNHYGGTPASNSGIPVQAGGILPIPEPATVVRVFAPTGLVVTVWGQRR